MSKWYITVDSKASGPFTDDEVIQAIRNRKYVAVDLIFKEGDVAWQSLGDIAIFKEVFEEIQHHEKSRAQIYKQDSESWVVLLKQKESGPDKYKQDGPYSADEITRQLLSGKIKYTDYVWKKGFDAWKRIAFVSEFDRNKGINENSFVQFKMPTPEEVEDQKKLDELYEEQTQSFQQNQNATSVHVQEIDLSKIQVSTEDLNSSIKVVENKPPPLYDEDNERTQIEVVSTIGKKNETKETTNEIPKANTKVNSFEDSEATVVMRAPAAHSNQASDDDMDRTVVNFIPKTKVEDNSKNSNNKTNPKSTSKEAKTNSAKKEKKVPTDQDEFESSRRQKQIKFWKVAGPILGLIAIVLLSLFYMYKKQLGPFQSSLGDEDTSVAVKTHNSQDHQPIESPPNLNKEDSKSNLQNSQANLQNPQDPNNPQPIQSDVQAAAKNQNMEGTLPNKLQSGPPLPPASPAPDAKAVNSAPLPPKELPPTQVKSLEIEIKDQKLVLSIPPSQANASIKVVAQARVGEVLRTASYKHSLKVIKKAKNYEADLSHLAPGIYSFDVQAGDLSKQKKISYKEEELNKKIDAHLKTISFELQKEKKSLFYGCKSLEGIAKKITEANKLKKDSPEAQKSFLAIKSELRGVLSPLIVSMTEENRDIYVFPEEIQALNALKDQLSNWTDINLKDGSKKKPETKPLAEISKDLEKFRKKLSVLSVRR